MLRVSALTKSYGGDRVLQDVSFVLSLGERLGLVGPNGSGKSTLLRLITREIQPDSGSVWSDPGSRVAYLPQYPIDELELTVRESLLRGAGRIGNLQGSLTEMEQQMADGGDIPDDLHIQYAQLREHFESLDGYRLEARMEAVIAGLGLGKPLEATVGSLSGGTKTKLSLARLLLSDAEIMLLDEPTNYLDLPALLWLERFVSQGTHSYILVSHDRRFLDRTVTGILELKPETHAVREWPGNYSDYAMGKERERRKHAQAYSYQQEHVVKVEEDIRHVKEQARSVERSTQSDVQRRYAKKVAKKAIVRERKLDREIEREGEISKPVKGWNLHLDQLGRDPVIDDRIVLEIHDIHAGYGNGEVLLSDANFLVLDEPTSHMDIEALEAMEAALAAFMGPLLLVSHDRAFAENIGVTSVQVMQRGLLTSIDRIEMYEQGLT